MNDPRNFGYQDGSAAMGPPYAQQQQPHQPGMPMPQHKFSPDEMRVLADCNRESFFQRCLPLGTAMGLSTFLAVQKGHLKPNPRFGAFPKVSLAVVVGYFLGKLSYQQACAEKLMALPGSYIGQLLRERRDGKIGGASMQTTQSPSMFGASPGDIYSDAGPGNSLDLDTDRPLFSDDSYRPDSDVSGGAPGGAAEAPARPALSYDDLRRRNRGAYTESKQDPYRVEQSPRDAAAPPPVPRVRDPQPSTNKYGDAME